MSFENPEYISINENVIKIGDPITKDILDRIKENFDNHEFRINSLATTSVSVPILNGDVSFYGFSFLEPDIFNFKARQDISINDFRVQLFSKQGITSGSLVLRLEKSIDTNNANFSTILNSDLSFNFSTEPDYLEKVASINASLNNITTGQVLRIKVIGIPFGFTGKILVSIGGQ